MVEELAPKSPTVKGIAQVKKQATRILNICLIPKFSGDMAGLAFGMIFGGMLLAGVIYFFALRNNVRAGIPVMRGFDNPLTGLTNLVK